MNEVDGIRQEDYCEMCVCCISIKITYLLINVPCTCRSRARTCAENRRYEENSRFHHFIV